MKSNFSRAASASLKAALAAVTIDTASAKDVYRQAAQRTPRTHPKYMPFLLLVLYRLLFGSASSSRLLTPGSCIPSFSGISEIVSSANSRNRITSKTTTKAR